MRAVLAIALLLNACATVSPRAALCDQPQLLPFVQSPPLTLDHWRGACVIVGVEAALK